MTYATEKKIWATFRLVTRKFSGLFKILVSRPFGGSNSADKRTKKKKGEG